MEQAVNSCTAYFQPQMKEPKTELLGQGDQGKAQ